MHTIRATPTTGISNVVSSGPGPAAKRFQLDYAAWYARIAAPDSRIGLTQSAMRPIDSLDIAVHPAKSAGRERRIA
jgi:hypothetical protein